MRLFITGVSGMLGLNLALQLRDRFDVHGSYFTHGIKSDGIGSIYLNFTSSANSIVRILASLQPDVVIHAAGLTNVEVCEAEPKNAQRLNVDYARETAKAAHKVGARLVHMSTDHIFDGTSPMKDEEAGPKPLNVYARTKHEAEAAVLDACPEALLIRTNFYGWGPVHRPSFTDWLLNNIGERNTLTMFTDVYFTPILINDLVEILVKLMASEASGVYHVAGGERLSKFAFALKLADVFGFPMDTIREISVDDFDFKATRPKDMSLDCHKVEDLLGERMPTADAGLKHLKRLGEEGWPRVLAQVVQV